jgi:broad specificity phosphatase PhoE
VPISWLPLGPGAVELYCSDFQRTLETAQIIGRQLLPPNLILSLMPTMAS